MKRLIYLVLACIFIYSNLNAQYTGGIGDGFAFKYGGIVLVKPNNPTLIFPFNCTINQAVDPQFKWDKIFGAIKYKIEISRDSGFTDIINTQIVGDTIYKQAPSIFENSKLYWRVKAYSGSDSSEYSVIWSFRTLSSPIISSALDKIISKGYTDSSWKWYTDSIDTSHTNLTLRMSPDYKLSTIYSSNLTTLLDNQIMKMYCKAVTLREEFATDFNVDLSWNTTSDETW